LKRKNTVASESAGKPCILVGSSTQCRTSGGIRPLAFLEINVHHKPILAKFRLGFWFWQIVCPGHRGTVTLVRKIQYRSEVCRAVSTESVSRRRVNAREEFQDSIHVYRRRIRNVSCFIQTQFSTFESSFDCRQECHSAMKPRGERRHESCPR
jgi:hypothetical protein